MTKPKLYRHGELCFESIKSIPKGLEKTDDKNFLVGSHGHPHSYDKGTLYRKEEGEYVLGYFAAKDSTLLHEEHGKGNGRLKKAKLPDGNYRIRRAVETINDELKPVID